MCWKYLKHLRPQVVRMEISASILILLLVRHATNIRVNDMNLVKPRRYSKRNLAQRAIKKVVNMNVVDPRNLENHAIKKVVDIALEPRRYSKRNSEKHMIAWNPRNLVEYYLI